jgi:hypothetical protein
MENQLVSSQPAALHTAKEVVDEVPRPDIAWIPSFKVFKDRVERLQSLYPNRRTTLPLGWPTQVDAERAWAGSDFKSEDDYVLHLSAEDVVEIEAGLAYFKGWYSTFLSNTDFANTQQPGLPGNLGPDDVSPSTFPLPILGSRLVETSKTVHDGRGFVVLRGLDPDKYSSFDNILLYLGVTSYIAEKRGMQDFDGRMIREWISLRFTSLSLKLPSPHPGCRRGRQETRRHAQLALRHSSTGKPPSQ